jgi:cystathionine gamma-lyase
MTNDHSMTEDAVWADDTLAVHAGLPPAVPGAPLLPGPTFAAPYHLGDQAPGEFAYGREANPSVRLYEDALGRLERGDAIVFASGMAAVSAVLLDTLRPGDTVVIPSDGYYVTRALARSHLAEMGVVLREVPTAEIAAADVAGARLVLLETPANPGLDVCDIENIATAAHAVGALVAVDNTTATPLGQLPLDLGADFSIASDTKALTGHSDLLLGHVAVRDPALRSRIREWRTRTGSIAGPFEAWLAHRSLGTVSLRLAQQAANAAAVVTALAERTDVTGLRYPGRAGDPAHSIAARQMRRFGGVVSFTLRDAEVFRRFIAASSLVAAATSFGGLHTTADRRAQWSGDAVEEGFVRLSCGCEDTADLVTDIVRALDAARDQRD